MLDEPRNAENHVGRMAVLFDLLVNLCRLVVRPLPHFARKLRDAL